MGFRMTYNRKFMTDFELKALDLSLVYADKNNLISNISFFQIETSVSKPSVIELKEKLNKTTIAKIYLYGADDYIQSDPALKELDSQKKYISFLEKKFGKDSIRKN
ncbi:MAG: hypothetical protein JSV92_02045 [archaeon]|nr:MAG: hypothetical protein JSV92_02045 [archaeon]